MIPVIRNVFLAALSLATVGLGAEERQPLSLVAAQPLRSGEVTATGRTLAQSSTRIGSRLAAHIVEWGKNEAGQPLDVGMAVKKGQRLFAIDPSTFKAKVDAAEAALGSAQAALDNLKAPTRKERLDVLRTVLAELDTHIKDRERDEARFRRLVEVDHTMPVKRLEEVVLELSLRRTQRTAAQAKLDEALAGPTPTEIAVAEAKIRQEQAALAAARLDLNDVVVTAPFDAVITRRWKSLGDYVAGAPYVEVIELTTIDHLEADLRLPEAYFPQLAPGKTHLTLRSLLLKNELDLIVTRLVPDIEVQQGTFAFRVAIPPDLRGGLVPGAFVTATLKLADHSEGVILPLRAVLYNSTKPVVMVASEGKMHRRPVELGDRLTENIIVRSGVQPGESVVVGPPEELKDGAPLPAYLLPEKK